MDQIIAAGKTKAGYKLSPLLIKAFMSGMFIVSADLAVRSSTQLQALHIWARLFSPWDSSSLFAQGPSFLQEIA